MESLDHPTLFPFFLRNSQAVSAEKTPRRCQIPGRR